MATPGISYVCIRPEHHRRQTRAPRFTSHHECCAFCPADAAHGHEWFSVPEARLETLEALGWIPRGASRRCASGERMAPEREPQSSLLEPTFLPTCDIDHEIGAMTGAFTGG